MRRGPGGKAQRPVGPRLRFSAGDCFMVLFALLLGHSLYLAGITWLDRQRRRERPTRIFKNIVRSNSFLDCSTISRAWTDPVGGAGACAMP